MDLSFLGAANTVTGSRYLLRAGDAKAPAQVLVDCGLFQGLKALRLKNWEPFPVAPADIRAVFLTHAHLDHSGYLPRLVREGFKGSIVCSMPTADLCKILLFDSAKLMEEEANWANKRGYSKHAPALPLYDSQDVEKTLSLFEPVSLGQKVEFGGFQAEYFKAGHILGACSIRIAPASGGPSILFSGDLGRPADEVMVPPEAPPESDYIVLESTYGGRKHPDDSLHDELAACVQDASRQGGVLLIPAFTVGRAQQLLYALTRLKKAGRIPALPTYLDSPMATDVSELYCKHTNFHRLASSDCEDMLNGVEYVRTPDESKVLDRMPNARIIVSASGMATGGRVLHHLHALAGDPKNIILFTGYQAAGTRGADLVAGIDQIKIHGDYVKVNAQVRILGSYSAHADYRELLSWLAARESKKKPKRVFLTHGEPGSCDSLRRYISDRFQWECEIPALGETTELG